MADAAALAARNRYGLSRRADRRAIAAACRGSRTSSAPRSGMRPTPAVLPSSPARRGPARARRSRPIRDGYEKAGYRVIGMAWTNTVVQDMRRDGYREATTIASELRRLDSGASQWDRRTVLIVDEAGMLSTQHLAAVTSQARAAGAKLILAGDDKQLASIERGGLFGALKEKHGGAELHEVVRVSDAEQQRAFNLMHQGEYLPALAIFAQAGRDPLERPRYGILR